MEWISPATWAALRGEGTDAHRLASAPGIWLERFGDDLLLSHQAAHAHVLAELDARCAAYDFSPRRVFGKYLPQRAAERNAPALLRGENTLPMETEVQEAYIHCPKHIPRLVKAPLQRRRAWGSDNSRRKGGDYFGVKAARAKGLRWFTLPR